VNAKQITTLLVLALVAVAALLLNHQEYTPGLSQAEPGGPDAWIEEMSLQAMDSAGKPVYNMTAAHMVHYPENDRIELTTPRVDIKRPDGSEWQVSAMQGESTTNGSQIWLQGDVNIVHRSEDSHNSLHITTRDLLVKPVEQMAETENEASIVSTHYRLEATGLTADFKTGQVKLHSRVKGRIDAAG